MKKGTGMRNYILAMLGLAISAQVSAQAIPADVKSKFALILKDPGSLQFQVYTRKPGLICGRYNAKNSYGGYVGYKHFSYQAGTLYTVGTIIRPDGSISDVDQVNARKPKDFDGIRAMMNDGKAIMDEIEGALSKC